MEISKSDKITLLQLARYTIASKLGIDYDRPVFEKTALPYSGEHGAFVTLHIDGKLRGCIGYIKGVSPLCETIEEMANAAAFSDHRFRPIANKEFTYIDIEISILSPIKVISSINEIIPGRDGLIIKKGYNSGLLLPQVAVEYGWTREKFLDNCCMKAGISSDSWKSGNCEISTFTAEVFGEKTINDVSQ